MRQGGMPPVCTHCGSTKSPLWRRGAKQEVLCNACGLYWKHHGSYRPLSLKVAADRKTESTVGDFPAGISALRYDRPVTSSGASRPMHALAQSLPKTITAGKYDRTPYSRSHPLRTGNILLATGQYGYSALTGNSFHNIAHPISTPMVTLPRLQSQSGSDDSLDCSMDSIGLQPSTLADSFSRRSSSNEYAFRRRQIRAATVLPNLRSIMNQMKATKVDSNQEQETINVQKKTETSVGLSHNALKFIIHNGVTMYQGDHVAVRGEDHQVYYAVLKDMWLTEACRRFCKLRWLLPKAGVSLDLTDLGPDCFSIGPMHPRVESMNVIVDVFYSPYKNNVPVSVIRQMFLIDSGIENLDPAKQASVCPPSPVFKSTNSARSSSFNSSFTAEEAPSAPMSTSISDEVPLNNIEGAEIAAKMLISML